MINKTLAPNKIWLLSSFFFMLYFTSPMYMYVYSLYMYIHIHAYVLSHLSLVQLIATPWTIYIPPSSSAHMILQVRILEWIAMPSSRGSSQPRNQTCVSCNSCIAGGFFTPMQLGKLIYMHILSLYKYICTYT